MFLSKTATNIFDDFEEFERDLDEHQSFIQKTCVDVMGAMRAIRSIPKVSYIETKLLEAYEIQYVQPSIERGFSAVLIAETHLPITFEVNLFIQSVVIACEVIAHPERQKKLPYFRIRNKVVKTTSVKSEVETMDFVDEEHKQKANKMMSLTEVRLKLQKGGIELNPGPRGKGPVVRRRPRRPYRNNSGQANRGGQTATHMVALQVNKPRNFMRGMPSSFYVKLMYTIPLTQVTGGGTTNSLRYRSDAYDVDPALGSTAMAYFTELAAIYSRFRCHAMHYTFNVSNQEAFPTQLIHGFSPLVFSSTALGANYAENRFFRTLILSPINGARSTVTLKQSITAGTLFGAVQPYTDDLFTGSTTSSTLSASATMNCYIGGISAAVPVNGFFVGGLIELDLELYRRNDIVI